MGVSFSTPYYLAGNQKHRWHRNKGEKSLATAGGAAITGAALRNAKYRGAGEHFLAHRTGIHVQLNEPAAHAASNALFGLGAAAGAYSAYHYTRAAKYNSEQKAKKRKRLVKNG